MRPGFSLVIFVSFVLFSCSAKNKEDIKWYSDIDKAMSDAAKNHKVIMVDFYTDWCSWCKKLDNETYKDRRVIEKAQHFISLKVNPEKGDRESGFAKRYNVEGFPSIVFINHEGAMIRKIGGFQDAGQFIISMESIDKAKEIPDMKELYSKGDIDKGFELVALYTDFGQLGEAAYIIEDMDKSGKLSDSKKNEYYMTAGFGFIESGLYEKAAAYFKMVVDRNRSTKNDDFYKSYLYYNYSIFLNRDILSSKKGIEDILKDEKLPAVWRKEFRSFISWMNENSSTL